MHMNWMQIVSGLVAVGLLVYLVIALIDAEKL
jgi:K+-transporting ATPase KdpF subunit